MPAIDERLAQINRQCGLNGSIDDEQLLTSSDLMLQSSWNGTAPAVLSYSMRRAVPGRGRAVDVRSEVFRRALEAVNPGIQTLGFAGFFGLTTSHRGFASDVQELRLPVLLNPGLMTCSGGPDDARADQSSRLKARAKRAWGRFKLAAVSSFAFVEATGPIYVAKLCRDALGLKAKPAPNDPLPRFDPPLDLSIRAKAAETVLRAMSLTGNFARLVLFAGHGANVVNNPHASGLHCGACGGYSGEVNARLLATLLNDKDVRMQLVVDACRRGRNNSGAASTQSCCLEITDRAAGPFFLRQYAGGARNDARQGARHRALAGAGSGAPRRASLGVEYGSVRYVQP